MSITSNGVYSLSANNNSWTSDEEFFDLKATYVDNELDIDEEITKRYTISKAKRGEDGEEGRSPTFRGYYEDNYNALQNGETITYVAIDPSTNQPGRGDTVDVRSLNVGSNYKICIETHTITKNSLTAAQQWNNNSSKWASFGAEFESVATDILLAQDASITNGLIMGKPTEDGFIISNEFKPGVNFNPLNLGSSVDSYDTAGFLLGRDDSDGVYFDIGGTGVVGQTGYIRFDSKNNGKLEIAGSFINNTIIDEGMIYTGDWGALSDREFDTFTSFIGGGFNNELLDGSLGDQYSQNIGSAIVGGAWNKVKSRFSFIGGGYSGDCRDNFSAIVGGFRNSMPLEEPGDHQGANFIGCGIDNVISGGASQGIVNGINNQILGNLSTAPASYDYDNNWFSPHILGKEIGDIFAPSLYEPANFVENKPGFVENSWWPCSGITSWGTSSFDDQFYGGLMRGPNYSTWVFHVNLGWCYFQIPDVEDVLYLQNELLVYGIEIRELPGWSNYLMENLWVYHENFAGGFKGWFLWQREGINNSSQYVEIYRSSNSSFYDIRVNNNNTQVRLSSGGSWITVYN